MKQSCAAKFKIPVHQLMIYSNSKKTTMNEEKVNEGHRELFESPIQPLQVNDEMLWKKKDISGNSGTAFALIQRSLEDASRDRVGHALASAIRKFRRKIESITNGKKGKAFDWNLKGCLSFFVASARKRHTASYTTLHYRGSFTKVALLAQYYETRFESDLRQNKTSRKANGKANQNHYVKCL